MINKDTKYAYGTKARNCSNFGYAEAPVWYFFCDNNKEELPEEAVTFLKGVTAEQWAVLPKEFQNDRNFIKYIRALPDDEWVNDDEAYRRGVFF